MQGNSIPLQPPAGTGRTRFRYTTAQVLAFTVWPIGILIMHFTLAEYAGFFITAAVIIGTVITLYLLLTTKIHPISLLVVHGVIGYALLLGFKSTDNVEYVRSLAQFINLTLVVLMAFTARLPGPNLMARSVRVLLWGAGAVGMLIILQAIFLNLFNSYFLLNPFGAFSMEGPGRVLYEPHPLAPLKRPNGLYSEPSVAGWVMAFSGAVALASPILCRKNYWYIAVICLTAAALTFSLSGFLNVSAILMIYVLSSSGSKRTRLPLIFLAVVLLGMVVWLFVDLKLYARLYTVFDEGQSVYFRFFAPLQLLADSLPEHPFGHPLGHTDYIAEKTYMVNWERGRQTNIDNSFFLFSFYLGIPGVLASLLVLWSGMRLVIRRSMAGLVVMAMLMALGETGSLWSHGMVLLIGYTIVLARFILWREKQAPKRARLAWW